MIIVIMISVVPFEVNLGDSRDGGVSHNDTYTLPVPQYPSLQFCHAGPSLDGPFTALAQGAVDGS